MFTKKNDQFYIVSDDGVNIVATRTNIPPKPSGFIKILWGIMLVMIFCVFTYDSKDVSLQSTENNTAIEADMEEGEILSTLIGMTQLT